MDKSEKMKRKILIIAGPTATGKTSFGLKMAKKLNGEIISADSRQVYRYMDIGTGKDMEGAPFHGDKQLAALLPGKNVGYYKAQEVKVWGLEIVEPDYSFNVSDFTDYCKVVLEDIFSRGKLPIIVGGTGLYIRSLIFPPETIGIAPDPVLRERLNKLTLDKLQEQLGELDPAKWDKMNFSDRQNPRRLIRAIEVAGKTVKEPSYKLSEDILFLILSAPYPYLYRRIDRRVDDRVNSGSESEVRKLLVKGYSWELTSMSASGYRQWRSYFEGKISSREVVKIWKFDEHGLARKQMTWFRSVPDSVLLDISQKNWEKVAEDKIREWYN